MTAGLDSVAPRYAASTEELRRYKEITRKDVLGAALKRRSAKFVG